MFDWLSEALYNYYLTLSIIAFVAFLLGVGMHSLWTSAQDERDMSRAAYDACIEDEPTDDDEVARRLLNF